jgi:hypothetical protein
LSRQVEVALWWSAVESIALRKETKCLIYIRWGKRRADPLYLSWTSLSSLVKAGCAKLS